MQSLLRLLPIKIMSVGPQETPMSWQCIGEIMMRSHRSATAWIYAHCANIEQVEKYMQYTFINGDSHTFLGQKIRENKSENCKSIDFSCDEDEDFCFSSALFPHVRTFAPPNSYEFQMTEVKK